MIRFELEDGYIEKNKTQIANGSPVEVQVRDNEEFSWKFVKVILSQTSKEGFQPVAVDYSSGGLYSTGQQWYMKIIEELPEETLFTIEKPYD